MVEPTPLPSSAASQLPPPRAATDDAVPALSSAEQTVRRRVSVAPAVWVLAVIAVVGLLYFARAFFIPLMVSILASYTLAPLVDYLEKWRLPRVIAAALVLSALAAGLGSLAVSLRDDVQQVVAKLPDTARQLRQSINAARGSGPSPLQQLQKAATEIQRAAAEAAGGKPPPAAAAELFPAAMLRDYLVASSSALAIGTAVELPLVLLLTYFLLASGAHFRRKLMAVAGPSLSRKKVTLGILNEIDGQVQRYMLVTLVTNFVVGLGTWLAFWALGLDKAGLWGVAAGVLHFIPYLGPAAIIGASAVAAFIQFGSLAQAAAVAGAAVAVSGVAGMLFMPWLQSRVSHTNAAVLFIALLFFGWLWGVWGLLLGAPMLAILKVISDRVEPLYGLGQLLGR